MRTALLIATVAALFTSPISAEEPATLDLTQVCKSGCVILIHFQDGGAFPNGSEHAGAFKSSTVNNPMSFFSGMVTTDTGQTVYRLVSEPGAPMFNTVALIQDHMNALNSRILRAGS